MKKDLIKNENKIEKDISTALDKMESSEKVYVYSVIGLGDVLIKARESIGKSRWQEWIDDKQFPSEGNNSRKIGYKQAQKYIRIAKDKILVLQYFKDKTSINSLDVAISNATQEDREKAEELTQAEVEKSLAEKKARYEEAQAKKAKAAQDKKDGIIDGEFSEVKAAIEPEKINIEPKAPKPEPEKTSADLFHEEVVDIIDTQEQINLDLSRENSRLEKIISSDDNVAFLLSENARLTRELADMTNSSNRHMANAAKLQGENNGLRDQLKRLRKESKVIVK